MYPKIDSIAEVFITCQNNNVLMLNQLLQIIFFNVEGIRSIYYPRVELEIWGLEL